MSEFGPPPGGWISHQRGEKSRLGSENFVVRMKAKLEEMTARPRAEESWAGIAVEEMEEDRATKLLKRGAQALGYGEGERVRGMDRFLLAGWARLKTKASLGWLAEQFGLRTRGGMSYRMRRALKLTETDREMKKRWKILSSHAGNGRVVVV